MAGVISNFSGKLGELSTLTSLTQSLLLSGLKTNESVETHSQNLKDGLSNYYPNERNEYRTSKGMVGKYSDKDLEVLYTHFDFACVAGTELGNLIALDIVGDLRAKKCNLGECYFTVVDTSMESVSQGETDDLVVTIKTLDEVLTYKSSLKTKSASGNKIVGNMSSTATIFVEKLLRGTVIAGKYKSEIEGMLNEVEGLKQLYNETKKETQLTPDKASKVVDSTLGYKWKPKYSQGVSKVFDYIQTLQEYTQDKSTIIQNILNIQGIKSDTNLYMALRDKGNLRSHLVYSSRNCPIYKDIRTNLDVDITFVNEGGSGLKTILTYSNTTVKFDYECIPNGFIPYFNPYKVFKLR